MIIEMTKNKNNYIVEIKYKNEKNENKMTKKNINYPYNRGIN